MLGRRGERVGVFAFRIASWSKTCIESSLYTGTILTIKYSLYTTCNKSQLYLTYTVQQCQLLKVAFILSNLIDNLTIIIININYIFIYYIFIKL